MKKILLPLLALIFVSVITRANNYYVTTAADTGAGSLRVMIDSANANPGLDTITLSLTVQDTIHLGSSLHNITDSLVITGLPCQNPTISGDSIALDTSAIEVLNDSTPLTLAYLNIINCNAGNSTGGAAVNAGLLYINYCYFYGNFYVTSLVPEGYGGAVRAFSVWAYNSTFYGNSCTIGAGGLSADGGALFANDIHLFNCIFVANSAYSNGGAIYGGISAIENCTITGNSASGGQGSAIWGSTSLNGIVGNNIIWGNPGNDTGNIGVYALDLTTVSGGCNVLQNLSVGDGFQTVQSDTSGANPQFGTFGYYSGCVPVLPILCGSIAQNHASCAGATDTDAQGIAAQGVRDAGAFEITSPHLYSDSLDSIQPGTTADLYDYFNTTGLTIQWPDSLNDSTAMSVDTGTYTVIGTNFLGCSDTATITIIYGIDTTLGINKLTSLNSIHLYPNPAWDHVTITWSDKSTSLLTLKLTDMLGRTVLMQNIDGTAGKFTIPIASYSSGTYYVSLTGGANNISGAKLVVLER